MNEQMAVDELVRIIKIRPKMHMGYFLFYSNLTKAVDSVCWSFN